VRVLNQLKQHRGAPRVLFCDNGAEFTGQMMDLWAYKRSEDRLLASRQADRQRLLRIVQWDLPLRVPRHQLVQQSGARETNHRSMAPGMQCESSSQGSRLQDTRGIRQPDRGAPRSGYNSNKLKTNLQLGTDFSGPSSFQFVSSQLVQKWPGIPLPVYSMWRHYRKVGIALRRRSLSLLLEGGFYGCDDLG
jgi:hypothetical protein